MWCLEHSSLEWDKAEQFQKARKFSLSDITVRQEGSRSSTAHLPAPQLGNKLTDCGPKGEMDVCPAPDLSSLQSLKWKSPFISSCRGGTLPSNWRKWYFPQIQAMSVKKMEENTAGKTAQHGYIETHTNTTQTHTHTETRFKKKEIPSWTLPMVLSTTSLTKK